MQWHHLLCAAGKHPTELRAALADFSGEVPNRAERDAALQQADQKAAAKPTGHPYADHAPTGRAKCMQSSEPIEKGTFRVAVERELELGGNATRGTGYLHPGCVVANLENAGGSLEELIEGLRATSRLPEAELDGVIADVEQGGDAS